MFYFDVVSKQKAKTKPPPAHSGCFALKATWTRRKLENSVMHVTYCGDTTNVTTHLVNAELTAKQQHIYKIINILLRDKSDSRDVHCFEGNVAPDTVCRYYHHSTPSHG